MSVKKVELVKKEVPCLPESFYEDERRFYFPVNSGLISSLVGKVLTQIESMNLSEKTENANKDIFKQIIWTWFGDVQENSVTSKDACIGPIESYDEAYLPR